MTQDLSDIYPEIIGQWLCNFIYIFVGVNFIVGLVGIVLLKPVLKRLSKNTDKVKSTDILHSFITLD